MNGKLLGNILVGVGVVGMGIGGIGIIRSANLISGADQYLEFQKHKREGLSNEEYQYVLAKRRDYQKKGFISTTALGCCFPLFFSGRTLINAYKRKERALKTS